MSKSVTLIFIPFEYCSAYECAAFDSLSSKYRSFLHTYSDSSEKKNKIIEPEIHKSVVLLPHTVVYLKIILFAYILFVYRSANQFPARALLRPRDIFVSNPLCLTWFGLD